MLVLLCLYLLLLVLLWRIYRRTDQSKLRRLVFAALALAVPSFAISFKAYHFGITPLWINFPVRVSAPRDEGGDWLEKQASTFERRAPSPIFAHYLVGRVTSETMLEMLLRDEVPDRTVFAAPLPEEFCSELSRAGEDGARRLLQRGIERSEQIRNRTIGILLQCFDAHLSLFAEELHRLARSPHVVNVEVIEHARANAVSELLNAYISRGGEGYERFLRAIFRRSDDKEALSRFVPRLVALAESAEDPHIQLAFYMLGQLPSREVIEYLLAVKNARFDSRRCKAAMTLGEIARSLRWSKEIPAESAFELYSLEVPLLRSRVIRELEKSPCPRGGFFP